MKTKKGGRNFAKDFKTYLGIKILKGKSCLLK